MSLRAKLIAIVCFVALVPLTVSAFTALRIHRRAYERVAAELEQRAAQSAAALAAERLAAIERAVLQAVAAVPWTELTGEAELEGAVWLIYQQHDEIVVVTLAGEDGAPAASAALMTPAERTGRFAAHPVANAEVLQAFASRAPAGGAGAPFAAGGGGPYLPITVPLPAGAPGRAVAVAVTLEPLCERLGELGAPPVELVLLDPGGRRVCAGGRGTDLAPAPAALAGQVGAREYADAGRLWRASIASAGDAGWRLVAVQPREAATGAGDRMRLQTLFWIAASLVLAVAAGWYLARGIHRPVAALTRGAEELARGHYDYRIPEAGDRDELGRLARAFNHMGSEIQSRNAEIEAWNQELAERVEVRTRELKEAQKQLVNSEKMAAVTSLAAGMAHEINNPLTGVLGLTQVMRARAEAEGNEADVKRLTSVERSAQRIRDIVQSLLSFSTENEGQGMRPLELAPLVYGVVALVGGRAEGLGVTIEHRLAPDLLIAGNDAQLRQALLHIAENALAAMPDGGTLEVTVASIEDELARVRITDSGRGIAPEHLGRVFEPFFTTKQVWQSRGLGLTVAFRVIEGHQGTIKLDSALGKGTTVTITLPLARGGAHLV